MPGRPADRPRRILAETGRLSASSMFRVGVFSGDDMLAEGAAWPSPPLLPPPLRRLTRPAQAPRSRSSWPRRWCEDARGFSRARARAHPRRQAAKRYLQEYFLHEQKQISLPIPIEDTAPIV